MHCAGGEERKREKAESDMSIQSSRSVPYIIDLSLYISCQGTLRGLNGRDSILYSVHGMRATQL